MKTWLNKISVLILLGSVFCSCEQADDPIRKTSTTTPVLTTSTTTLVLKSEEANIDAFTITWSAADYGYTAKVTYVLQVDKKGNDFKNATEITIDSALVKQTYTDNIPGWKIPVSTYVFDEALSKLGITTGTNDVELRIKSFTKTTPTPVYSNIIAVSVTPYTDVVISEPVLSSSASTFTAATTDPVKLSWTAAAYTLDDPIVYTLQADTESDFVGATEVTIDDGSLTKTYSVVDFNSLAKQAGLIVKTPGTLYLRIRSTQTGSFTPAVYSNTVSITATTYNVYPENLYLVGGSTSAGWTPANAIKFINTDEGKFEMYAYLTVADGFKFLQVQDWAGDWGKSKTIEGGLAQDNEDNVTVTADGFYWIKCDFTNKTYSVTQTNWGIVGDATGSWDNDQDMTFTNGSGSYTWSIDITLGEGAYKFRANDGWDINYGYGGSAGTLQFNGGTNISSPGAGEYHIELILDPSGYHYTIVENK